MSFLKVTWSSVVILAIGSLAGCTQEGGRAEISGHVQWQGQPLEDGNIVFIPPSGPAAQGVIQGGEYFISSQIGPAPGNCLVQISFPKPTGKMHILSDGTKVPERQEALPLKYNRESTMRYQVVSGENSGVDFVLE
ncbi:hypothetical protein AB1K70_04535 [Bremerella sp. JC770]|uniref:hypothetical protein n=1 Tax=Bremerella sp. JC770 TaxID=3232137 RepID=UPI003457B483